MKGDEQLASGFILLNFVIVLLTAAILPGDGKLFPALLFLLPPLLLLSGRKEILGENTTLRNWFIAIVTVCMIVNSAFWAIYANQERDPWGKKSLEWLAQSSCFIAFVLVLLVFYVTRMMIKRREAEQRAPTAEGSQAASSPSKTGGIKDKAAKFCDEIRQHNFLCLIFFLIIFLYVTYFMSFALAFHDHGSHGPGLVADVQDPQDATGASATDPAAEAVVADGASTAKTANGNAVARRWRFFFRQNSANLEYDEELLKLSPKRWAEAAQEDEWLPYEIENTKQLNEVVDALDENGRQYQRAQLIVLGHSNDQPIQQLAPRQPALRYQSNFELSSARAYQIQYALSRHIEQRLGGRSGDMNLEWLIVPVGTEDVFVPEEKESSAEPISAESEEYDGKLCAEVLLTWVTDHVSEAEMKSFKKTHEFELFDYLYFMVYTITTTGYGDIKPVSTEAKFFASIANLYELFFLVIFVNVLLSFNRPEASWASTP